MKNKLKRKMPYSINNEINLISYFIINFVLLIEIIAVYRTCSKRTCTTAARALLHVLEGKFSRARTAYYQYVHA